MCSCATRAPGDADPLGWHEIDSIVRDDGGAGAICAVNRAQQYSAHGGPVTVVIVGQRDADGGEIANRVLCRYADGRRA